MSVIIISHILSSLLIKTLPNLYLYKIKSSLCGMHVNRTNRIKSQDVAKSNIDFQGTGNFATEIIKQF